MEFLLAFPVLLLPLIKYIELIKFNILYYILGLYKVYKE